MPKKNDNSKNNIKKSVNNKRTNIKSLKDPRLSNKINSDLPLKVAIQPLEEKVPFLIVKCIQSMKDYEDRRYGKNRICDILKGSFNRFIMENGHHHNPCFGVLKDFSRNNILDFIDVLTERSILQRDEGFFPTLDITGIGRELLRFRKRVKLEMPFDLQPIPAPIFNQDLYEHLQIVRLVQAKDEGVPPYRVIPNKCLVELCVERPGELDTLAQIHGFGPNKVQRYGELFLSAIAEYT